MSTTTRNGSGEIPGTRPTTTHDSRRRDGVPKPPPAYRRRKGYKQAIVTFTDVHTKKRRDYWLGPYGSPESRELYYRLIAEWEASDRRLPHTPVVPTSGAAVLTIAEVIRDYWHWVTGYYTPSEQINFKSALRVLRRLFGTLPATEFGPNCLRVLRDQMVRSVPTGAGERKRWTRQHVNGQIHRVCAMFKWAASHEMLPASQYQQLKTVPSLKRGRTTARESIPVQPVPIEHVEAVRPFLSLQVGALVDLQLHTGARGGELFSLRALDISMNNRSGIWSITLSDHKTAHHGHRRTIYLGPRAQAVIRPFLAGRAVDGFLFSPAEAERERRVESHAKRKTPLSCGNRPGTNTKPTPTRVPGDHYTAASYRRAIQRACDRAFPPPEVLQPKVLLNGRLETKKTFMARLTSEEKNEILNWKREHRWHPHQLRHTAATLIRREFGLEAARIALGHSSALVTDAVYAERDEEKVMDMMRQIG